MGPHYVALFRGHLNFSTVSLLSQTTFRYSMSNKSPEPLNPIVGAEMDQCNWAILHKPGQCQISQLALYYFIFTKSSQSDFSSFFLMPSFDHFTAPELWIPEAKDERVRPAWTDVVSA